MRQRATLHCLQTHPRVLYPFGTSGLSSPRAWGLRRRRWWRTCRMAALGLSGILLIAAAVLGTTGPSQDARTMVSSVVPPPQMVIVPETTLPPVLQRIAQCESNGQHFTKDGKVLRGHRNPQDMGLFQINTIVWAKEAATLGYDIRTPEGNTQMARYIFENYGSLPWHSSAKCWSRTS